MTGTPSVKVGRVNFCDATANYCSGIHLLGTAQITSDSIASITLIPGLGSHSYKAVFLGTGNNEGSSSGTVSLTVTGKFPTTTTIAQSGAVNDYTLTATTVGNGNLTIPPTGTISFIDSTAANQVLATANLGTATSSLNFVLSPASPTNLSVGTQAVADFNGDGKADITISDGSSLSVLLGNGNGTFAATASNYPVGASQLLAGDFNGDDRADIVAINASGSQILLGNGDGTFTIASNIATAGTPVAVVTNDFNNDGNADLAIVVIAPDGFSDSIVIYLGNGDGTFNAQSSTYIASRGATLVTGDFNNDGNRDLLTSASDGGTSLYLGNGDGTFTSQPSSPKNLNIEDAGGMLVGDFNNDGIDDIAFSFPTPAIEIFLGNGDATFTQAPNINLTFSASDLMLGDFNGDGKEDIAEMQQDQSVNVLLGNGDGTFTSQVAQTGNSSYINVADLNDDGIPDLVVGLVDTNSLNGLLTQLTETSTVEASNLSVPGTGMHAVLASYPGDANYASSVSATTSLTAITNTSLTMNISPAGSVYLGQQSTLTATLTPFSANGQSSDGETIIFYSNGSSIGTAPLHSGVATLTVNLPGGQNNVNATYNGDIALANSTSNTVAYTVNPTPAVAITLASSSISVSQSGSVTDTFTINPSTGYSGTVQFQCSNLPKNTTCSFSPSSVTFTGNNTSASATVTIHTGSAQSARMFVPGSADYSNHSALAAIICMPQLLISILAFRRSKYRFVLFLMAFTMSCTMFLGCGGGSPSNGANTNTPAGTYTIQLIVTGENNLSQNTPINITVQ